MKLLTISSVILVAGAAGFLGGYRAARLRAGQKLNYLAVSLVGDRFLHAISTVVQDHEGRYVMQGDEIEFLSDGPKTNESTLRPFALQFQRWDFFSPTTPRGPLESVLISERDKEETFIVRDGKVMKIDPIARMRP